MALKRDWQAYPATYRTREISILANWIQSGESGSFVGPAGAGKSNLIGFLSHRPEVVVQHLSDNALKLALVQVDLNNLTKNNLATFYRIMLRSLYEARRQLAIVDEALPAEIETLYRKVEEKTDPFISQSALRETLFQFREKQVRLVLILDPFDRFCQTAPTSVLDNLRGLRDSTVDLDMGQTCEIISHRFGVSREAMDAYSVRSHDRLAKAFDEDLVGKGLQRGGDRLQQRLGR